MKPLSIGIVGCGGIARFHADAYKTVPDLAITSVYDSSQAAAASFAREVGAEPAPSLAALAAMKLDAVSICTPPAMHGDGCAPFLQAGIPILCEKPLAANLEQARQLAERVRASDSLFMVAFCHRFHGPIIALKRLLEQGRLGRQVLARIAFTGQLALSGNHRADPKIAGGGCVIDNGTHAVDLIRYLLGEVDSVRGLISNSAQGAPVEDVGVVTLRMRDGALAEIATSFSTPIGANRVEVFGSEGTAIVSYWHEGEPDLRWRRTGDSSWTPVECSSHPPRFSAQIAHFIECVRSGRKPIPSVEDGLAASAIVAAAYGSAQKQAHKA